MGGCGWHPGGDGRGCAPAAGTKRPRAPRCRGGGGAGHGGAAALGVPASGGKARRKSPGGVGWGRCGCRPRVRERWPQRQKAGLAGQGSCAEAAPGPRVGGGTGEKGRGWCRLTGAPRASETDARAGAGPRLRRRRRAVRLSAARGLHRAPLLGAGAARGRAHVGAVGVGARPAGWAGPGTGPGRRCPPLSFRLPPLWQRP